MPNSAFSSANLVLLALTYFFYFGQFGVLIPYLGVFLDGRGFSSAQIGELFALITLARILGPNLLAAIADKTGQPLRCLQIGALFTFTTFCCAFVINGFWALTISFAFMMMCWTAILPQIEVLTLNCVHANPARYSKVRLWGSIGYIVLTVFTGKMIDEFNSEAPIIIGAFVLFSLFMATLFVRQPPADPSHQMVTESIWKKIHSPIFYGFLSSAILLQISFGPYYGFFALYTRDLGYSGQMTGWLIALGVVAEVLIFLQSGKLIARVGVKWILFISMLLTALRWYLLAVLADHLAVLIFSQILHAFSFGMAHAASMHFIYHYFNKKHQGQGQAIYASIAFGIGGAVGNYGAGVIWQQGVGAELAFTLAAGFALLSAFLLLFISAKRM
ncbi:MFS transporter [Paraglaciecola aquimarina]|uniref:MFS transporter n=1 Tax=Paraglaciecola aquimarina TaxID=1235557 RepID=A0ABU3SZK7_9ALTE|nr:MFS transporter [Paraglaciecola aquimarina]MDU0355451.1 MFS transporter [Paraglaciecola aquimarina]